MILYVILWCLMTCRSKEVTRLESGDNLKGTAFCRDCTCPATHSTYYNLPNNGKCIHATETGCFLRVDGYTTDVPFITQSMLNKTEFRISKNSGNFCPNTLTTLEASSVRMLALTDSWEVVPTFMSNSVLYSIPNVKEVKARFHAVWSGLLIRLEVRCKASNGNVYTPSENCVLFKYEGTATYPLRLSSFATKSKTTRAPVPLTTTATPAATTAIARTTDTSNWSLSSVLTTFTTAKTEARFNKLTSCECNNKLVIAGVTSGAINLILILIVIILICKVKKLDQTRIKKINTNNVAKSNFEYEYPEVKLNETVNGEQQGNNKQSCRNVQEDKNYAPLIFDSKGNVSSNYTPLSKSNNEIPIHRTIEAL